MKYLSNLVLYFLLLVLVFGCASFKGKELTTIDNRQVEFVKSEKGPHTIVFENGLGGTLEWWSKIIPTMCKEQKCFAYNRAGYGKSSISSTPRDGGHIIEELRSLLLAQGLRPPYVLVGHSLGGLYFQLYARKYPSEVAALILVDSTHPKQLQGDGAKKKWPCFVKLMFWMSSNETSEKELALVNQTGEEVLKFDPPSATIIKVLSAMKPMSETSKLAIYSNQLRVEIAKLYPWAEQIWVDSGHAIPYEKPEIVIAALREIIMDLDSQE